MYVGLSGPTRIHDTPQPTQNNMNIETLLQPDGSLMLDVTCRCRNMKSDVKHSLTVTTQQQRFPSCQ